MPQYGDDSGSRGEKKRRACNFSYDRRLELASQPLFSRGARERPGHKAEAGIMFLRSRATRMETLSYDFTACLGDDDQSAGQHQSFLPRFVQGGFAIDENAAAATVRAVKNPMTRA
jgi:hypothetical protein